MGETNIGWTDFVFNGWAGCSEAGVGCIRCYARVLDARFQYGIKKEDRAPKGVAPHWGPGAPRYRTAPGNWRGPILWNAQAERLETPRKVFCNSLSDVFDNEVPDEWRTDLFDLWRRTPWLRWIVLTKRVPNIRKMLPKDWGDGYPNVGLVATTADQAEFNRDAPRLLAVPARWHGFSLEPQVGPIMVPPHVMAFPGSKWFITGGESRQPKVLDGSGGGASADGDSRPWDPAWAKNLIDQARSDGDENTFVFVKQTGDRPVGMPAPSDGMGKDPAAWPAGIRVQAFPPELVL